MKHFKISEFDSPDEKGSGVKMNPEFLRFLDQVRENCGFAFHINSGYRTKNHNDRVGGSSKSSHMKGLAVDIAVHSGQQRHAIVEEAMKLGCSRIGIAKTFIHLDLDTEKPQGVIWTY